MTEELVAESGVSRLFSCIVLSRQEKVVIFFSPDGVWNSNSQ